MQGGRGVFNAIGYVVERRLIVGLGLVKSS